MPWAASTVHVEEASTTEGIQFNQGVMHMDGTTALAFVRERQAAERGWHLALPGASRRSSRRSCSRR